jgi:hypothetical protein
LIVSKLKLQVLVLSAIVTVTVGISLCSIYKSINRSNGAQQKISEVTSLIVLDMQGRTTKIKIANTPTIVVFFNSQCESCHQQLLELDNDSLIRSKANILAITEESEILSMPNLQHVKIFKTSPDINYFNQFNISVVPSTTIFLSNHKQLIIKGIISSNEIRVALQNKDD